MYLLHYGLNEKPFSQSPDPRYLWFGDRQLELYAALETAVLRGRGVIVLTGAVGTGKTTFIKSVESGLREKTVFANIRDPALNELEFYHLIAHGLGMKRRLKSADDFVRSMMSVVRAAASRRRQVVVAVDESQRIDSGLLKKILSLGTPDAPLLDAIRWIFVGHDELWPRFKGVNAGPIKAGKVDQFRMQPLGSKETGEYIRFRLRRAGAKQPVFSQKAIDRVYHYAAGHPRLINSICDLALLCGYSEDAERIVAENIDGCVDKVCLNDPPRQHRIPKKRNVKTTACLLASMCCLTAYGLWTYASHRSDDPAQRSGPSGSNSQHLVPIGEGLEPPVDGHRPPKAAPPGYGTDLSPTLPASTGYIMSPEYNRVSPKPGTGATHMVSQPRLPYGKAEDSPEKEDKTTPKQASAPQNADAASDGNFSSGNPGSPTQRTAREAEPDPASIIDWLLKK